MGQQLIVENRPSGVIPGEVVAKAAPDGYTLLVASGILWTGSLMQDTPYDPVRDFQPISLTSRQSNLLVVHPSLPVKSVKDLISLAKARPGELNYAAAGTGSSSHLAAELFKAMTGTSIVRIPYKASALALNDLFGGQVQLMFAVAAAVMPHVKSGRLKALSVSSLRPTAQAPGLPTIADSGVPGYESVSMHGVFAPARTSMSVVSRLNQEIVRFLKIPDVTEKFLSAGLETVGSSPDELAATMKSEMNRLGKVIKDAGIRAE